MGASIALKLSDVFDMISIPASSRIPFVVDFPLGASSLELPQFDRRCLRIDTSIVGRRTNGEYTEGFEILSP